MPRFARLRARLGKGADLRLLTAEYNLTHAAIDTGADIVFEYTAATPASPFVVVCREEIKPVGTPELVAQAVDALSGRAPAPGLLQLQKANHGWMGWDDWTEAHPAFAGWAVAEDFDSYVYLLEAAATGTGLALGWRRFIDPYVSRGDLIEMPVDWYSKDTRIIARLTRFRAQNPAAQTWRSRLEHLH
jgi:LysR family glycine cleavage system transcriptional activator